MDVVEKFKAECRLIFQLQKWDRRSHLGNEENTSFIRLRSQESIEESSICCGLNCIVQKFSECTSSETPTDE